MSCLFTGVEKETHTKRTHTLASSVLSWAWSWWISSRLQSDTGGALKAFAFVNSDKMTQWWRWYEAFIITSRRPPCACICWKSRMRRSQTTLLLCVGESPKKTSKVKPVAKKKKRKTQEISEWSFSLEHSRQQIHKFSKTSFWNELSPFGSSLVILFFRAAVKRSKWLLNLLTFLQIAKKKKHTHVQLFCWGSTRFITEQKPSCPAAEQG